jgi:hypothetical protein
MFSTGSRDAAPRGEGPHRASQEAWRFHRLGWRKKSPEEKQFETSRKLPNMLSTTRFAWWELRHRLASSFRRFLEIRRAAFSGSNELLEGQPHGLTRLEEVGDDGVGCAVPGRHHSGFGSPA